MDIILKLNLNFVFPKSNLINSTYFLILLFLLILSKIYLKNYNEIKFNPCIFNRFLIILNHFFFYHFNSLYLLFFFPRNNQSH